MGRRGSSGPHIETCTSKTHIKGKKGENEGLEEDRGRKKGTRLSIVDIVQVRHLRRSQPSPRYLTMSHRRIDRLQKTMCPGHPRRPPSFASDLNCRPLSSTILREGTVAGIACVHFLGRWN